MEMGVSEETPLTQMTSSNPGIIHTALKIKVCPRKADIVLTLAAHKALW